MRSKLLFILAISIGVIVMISCTKEDDDNEPIDVRVIDQKEDTSIATVKLRFDQYSISGLPEISFYDFSYNEYVYSIYLRTVENEVLFTEKIYTPNLPHKSEIFAIASDMKMRLILIDRDHKVYHKYDINPKDYENENEVVLSLEESGGVKIELKGTILK